MCKLVKVLLTVGIVSLIFMPISIVFGSGMALVALILSVLYILEENE